jgi:transposase
MELAELQRLVEAGHSAEEIAVRLGVSRATVVAWRRELGVTGQAAASRPATLPRVVRTCAVHGTTEFVQRSDGGWRCRVCRAESVARRRRRVKATLVEEAGGRCEICGYDRCLAALEFHHRDPANKRFAVAARGVARSLARARAEAAKCVLLCSNCHVEVEHGVAALPKPRYDMPRIPG